MSEPYAKQPPPPGGRRKKKKKKKEEGKAEAMVKAPPSVRRPHDATEGKPFVCWGVCVARLGTMLFALLTVVFHLAAFIFTLSYRYAEYKDAEAFSKYAGVAQADVAFEFLCMLPLAAVILGTYDSKRPNSRHIIFGGTMAALCFGVILTIIHCLGTTGVVKVIQEKPSKVYKKDGNPVPSFAFQVMLSMLLVKIVVGTILYSCLAWASLKHWHYLETLYEDAVEVQKMQFAKVPEAVLAKAMASGKNPGRKRKAKSSAPLEEFQEDELDESKNIMEDWDSGSQSWSRPGNPDMSKRLSPRGDRERDPERRRDSARLGGGNSRDDLSPRGASTGGGGRQSAAKSATKSVSPGIVRESADRSDRISGEEGLRGSAARRGSRWNRGKAKEDLGSMP